jgi:uncharacterized protein YpbB
MQFCEIDLSDMLPLISLAPFMDEIKKRERQRKQTAKKEESDKVKAEVAAALQASAMRFEHTNFCQSHNDVMFSLDDFEGCYQCTQALTVDIGSTLTVDIGST